LDDEAEAEREKAAELAQNAQSTATDVEHQFRGKLTHPFFLTSVRTGFLLCTRNAGDVVRFQRRSLREGRHW
jgi:hypothetical protein